MENQRETPKLEDFLEKGIPEDVALEAMERWYELDDFVREKLGFHVPPKPEPTPLERFLGSSVYLTRPRGVYWRRD